MAQILSLDGVSQGRTWKEAGTPGLYKGCAIGKSVSTFFCKMVCRIGKKAKEPTVNHLMTSKCLHFLGSSLRTMRMISSSCVGEHTDRAAFSWLTPQTPGLMSQSLQARFPLGYQGPNYHSQPLLTSGVCRQDAGGPPSKLVAAQWTVQQIAAAGLGKLTFVVLHQL